MNDSVSRAVVLIFHPHRFKFIFPFAHTFRSVNFVSVVSWLSYRRSNRVILFFNWLFLTFSLARSLVLVAFDCIIPSKIVSTFQRIAFLFCFGVIFYLFTIFRCSTRCCCDVSCYIAALYFTRSFDCVAVFRAQAKQCSNELKPWSTDAKRQNWRWTTVTRPKKEERQRRKKPHGNL